MARAILPKFCRANSCTPAHPSVSLAGIAVIIIILLNAFISVVTEKSANDALAALASMA